MSKRFIITRRNGTLEDWGADSMEFSPSHVLFLDKGEVTNALHADEVREIEVQEEG